MAIPGPIRMLGRNYQGVGCCTWKDYGMQNRIVESYFIFLSDFYSMRDFYQKNFETNGGEADLF